MVFLRQRKKKSQVFPEPDQQLHLFEFQTRNYIKELLGTPQPCGICSLPVDFTQSHTYPFSSTCAFCGAFQVSRKCSAEGSSGIGVVGAPNTAIQMTGRMIKGLCFWVGYGGFECYACWERLFHLFGDSSAMEGSSGCGG